MTTRTSTDPWIRLARITAATGLSSFVLLSDGLHSPGRELGSCVLSRC